MAKFTTEQKELARDDCLDQLIEEVQNYVRGNIYYGHMSLALF